MKKITGVRLGNVFKGQRPSEFILYREKTDSAASAKKRIIAFIKKNIKEFDILEFQIQDETGKKYVEKAENLKGEVINIVDDNTIAEINDDNTIDISDDVNLSEGALPNKHTLDQLKMVRRLSKKDDIGDRIQKMQGANLHYMRNPIDTGIETMQDFEKHNKKFQPNWNLKHLRPFSDEK